MEINNKLSIDLYAVLILQLMWSSFGFIFDQYKMSVELICLIIFSYIVATVAHIVLSNYLIGKQNILTYTKLYIYILLVINTILLCFSEIHNAYILFAIILTFVCTRYIKNNITKVMKVKYGGRKNPTRMLVILGGGLLGTYIPQFGIIIAFVIVNSVNFYLLYKHSSLDIRGIDNQ